MYYSQPRRKLLSDSTLGARQIRAVVSDGTPDRAGDVMVPEGCFTAAYVRNNVVLFNHNSDVPVGNAAPIIKNGRVEALIDFAPAGTSEKADEVCRLVKAGVLSAFSVGFNPIEAEPRPVGGFLFKRWELLEISCVSLPCNPAAMVLERGRLANLTRDGRVLAAQHVEALRSAHTHATAAARDVRRVLAAAGKDPNVTEDETDSELGYEAERRRRIDVAMRLSGGHGLVSGHLSGRIAYDASTAHFCARKRAELERQALAMRR
ncbi:MAG: HK97 family phage prohead protease [Hyphomicrobiales bacterium]